MSIAYRYDWRVWRMTWRDKYICHDVSIAYRYHRRVFVQVFVTAIGYQWLVFLHLFVTCILSPVRDLYSFMYLWLLFFYLFVTCILSRICHLYSLMYPWRRWFKYWWLVSGSSWHVFFDVRLGSNQTPICHDLKGIDVMTCTRYAPTHILHQDILHQTRIVTWLISVIQFIPLIKVIPLTKSVVESHTSAL